MIEFSLDPKSLSKDTVQIGLAFDPGTSFVNLPGKEWDRVRGALFEEGFQGKLGQSALHHSPEGRLLALGLGSREGMDLETFRRAGGRLARKAKEVRLAEACLEWPRSFGGENLKAFAEGLILGSYQFDRYKTRSQDAPKPLGKMIVRVGRDQKAQAQKALDSARIFTEGALLARDLINGAPSDVTPKVLADTARKFAGGPVRVKVFGKAQLKKMGAGGLLGVNRGSAEEPYLIHLHYRPSGKPKRSVAIVGKGITFDSGGLSLKPAGAMETMKMDMSGAAAVLGVFSQIAKVRPPVEVHGVIATTENMPGGRAFKPGDVLRAINGKTMEILNTDAEGRLILSDALSYSVQQKVDEIIDMATLTGACVVALGSLVAGAMSNDPGLLGRVQAATQREGERIWELPLVPEYKDDIKSKVADIKNVGNGREAGTITAAFFLQEFVGDTPWVHLDIAGPAYLEREYPAIPYLTFGGTGLMVRSLLTFLKQG